VSEAPIGSFAARLLGWFDIHGRHDLPWQHPRTPYRVWVSEIMLQQTQVSTVIGYFANFVARFPDLETLAAAEPDAVMAQWSGLGYYSRARNLQRAAKICVDRFQGVLPSTMDDLITLPGIGRSTAGAILAQAHGQSWPILDGNVRRVLTRHEHIAGDPANAAVQALLWKAAQACLPEWRVADYTQATMDLGAVICTRSRPACLICPVGADCQARIAGDQDQYPSKRAKIVRPLRQCTQLLVVDAAGAVLLERRPPVGIWPGLWSFIEAPTQEEAVVRLAAHEFYACKFREFDSLRHEFTHFSLDISVQHTRLTHANIVADADRAWYSIDQALALGLPQPVRRTLEKFRDD